MTITITVDMGLGDGPVLRDGADWQGENDVLAKSLQPIATPDDAKLLTYSVSAVTQIRDPFVWNPPLVYNWRDYAGQGFVTAVAVTTNGTSGATSQSVAVTGGTGSGLVLALVGDGTVFTSATVESQGALGYTDGDVVTAAAADTGAGADATFTLTVTPL